ncbi:MAG: glycosyltransferase [Bacteroidia bacterium]|nr:glycosyltransferase [Bacteroidia bacterium]
MFLLALIFFVLCTLLVFYTYIAFPWLLQIISRKYRMNSIAWNTEEDLPTVSIIIAAFNEEKVIEEKIRSILNSNYPLANLEILIGSDASDDKTNEIVQQLANSNSEIQLYEFKERRGKPSVINDLVTFSKMPLLILTDANVLFDSDTIFNLIKHFKNGKMGLVGANILNVGQMNDGISHQETSYIARENRIKYHEGIRWGTMMGPFGGCFAIRRELFKPVPANFLVDDFYICMQILKSEFACVNELKAICYEDVSNDILQEYKRKARISAGNFQNLAAFSGYLLKPFSPTGFCFISHKVLRWLSPFFLLISLFSLAYLSSFNRVYLFLFIAELLLLISPVFDAALRSFGLHWKLLRFVSYFSFMNLALLKGFFRYMAGVHSSVWTPTFRNTGKYTKAK